ncbi:MAG: glycosyltransferase family 4 protein [Candidatus Obscuribacterales bacterium]|nr:glycosyltransferase family 4 protein [Steroidobacteraceae bacterium]
MFPLDTSRREAIRQAINVPKDALMIVLVSRASYAKGLDFAVKVMAKLRMAGTTNIYAVHCGGGTELPEFETLADNLGAADQFRFLGARDDVHDILCAADAAFHPSESEAMSLAILEFMCAALPVLVPDRPSVSQTVEHEKTGLIYRHQDEDSAVGAIHRLSQNREFRLQLGVTARARCLDRYTVERANADFERLVATRLCA